MKPARGMTLVELMVIVAIIAILAAMAITGVRSAQRNASVSASVFELQVRLSGLRSKALAEQRDLVAMLVSGDGTGCGALNAAGCARYFLLADPVAGTWTFPSFDPATPGKDVAEVIDREVLPRGIDLAASVPARTEPRPFQTVKVFDPIYTRACGDARCMAFRFRANGDVEGELASGTDQAKGHAIAFTSDLEGKTHGAERRILLVGFPNGIIKSYAY